MNKSAQFIHIETYKNIKENKKKNHNSDVKETHAKGVISEARRDHGFTSHIEHVEAPKLLYGTDLNQLEQLVDHYSENAFIYDKNNKKKKLRADASVLLGGVISLDRKDIDQWEDYKKDSINYLKSKYKDNLKTIIEHTDEAHPHIHFYVIAPVGQLINNLHEGKNAVLEAKKNKHKNQQSEYIKAMTKFQDDFYERVSKKYGFSRIGEKPRSRMSRTEYKALTNERLIKNKIINDKKIEIRKLIKNKDIYLTEAKKEALDYSIYTFQNKNYAQKIIFSIDFNKKEKENLKKENKDLKYKLNNTMKRKDHYKNLYSEETKSNDLLVKNKNRLLVENEKLKKINVISNIETLEENTYERKSILGQNISIDEQQQQISQAIEKIDRKQRRTRERACSARRRKRNFRENFFKSISDIIRSCVEIFEIKRELEAREEAKKLNRRRKIKID